MGAAAGVILAEYKRRRDAKSRLIQMERQVPELIRALSANLRVGGNVSDAFHGIADELPEPIASPVRDLVRRLGTGVSIHEALHSFQTDAPTPSIERLTEAIRTSIEVGGSLESILGFIGEGVSDRIALDRERRAGTTQGRLSAIVVGGMPIGFLAITGLGESSPGRILFTEPIGWMLLLIGLMLEAAGFLWVKRIVRA
jgi:tight adherence protein B